MKSFDAGKLVRRLLAALGAEVDDADDAALVGAAKNKIHELRAGARMGGGSKAKGPTNPLIPGGGHEAQPMYMSLTDRLRAENEGLKMAKHDADIALAMAPPPKLSAEAESRLDG